MLQFRGPGMVLHNHNPCSTQEADTFEASLMYIVSPRPSRDYILKPDSKTVRHTIITLQFLLGYMMRKCLTQTQNNLWLYFGMQTNDWTSHHRYHRILFFSSPMFKNKNIISVISTFANMFRPSWHRDDFLTFFVSPAPWTVLPTNQFIASVLQPEMISLWYHIWCHWRCKFLRYKSHAFISL